MRDVYCKKWKLKKNNLDIFYYRKYKTKDEYCIRIVPVFKYSFLHGPTQIYEWQVECGSDNKVFHDLLKAMMWSDLFLYKKKKYILKSIFNPSCLLSDEEILKIAKENFKKIGERNERSRRCKKGFFRKTN